MGFGSSSFFSPEEVMGGCRGDRRKEDIIGPCSSCFPVDREGRGVGAFSCFKERWKRSKGAQTWCFLSFAF